MQSRLALSARPSRLAVFGSPFLLAVLFHALQSIWATFVRRRCKEPTRDVGLHQVQRLRRIANALHVHRERPRKPRRVWDATGRDARSDGEAHGGSYE